MNRQALYDQIKPEIDRIEHSMNEPFKMHKVALHPDDYQRLKNMVCEDGSDFSVFQLKTAGIDVIESPLVPKGSVMKIKDQVFDPIAPIYFMKDVFNCKYEAEQNPVDYSKVYQFRNKKAPRYLRRFN